MDPLMIAGAAGGMLPGLMGGAKNKREAKGFFGQPGQDSNASRWGGSPNGLGGYTSRQNQQARQADERAANTANYGAANAQGQGADQMAGLMQRRALGQVPSIAQQQADRQMGQAMAAQSAQAASARGPAGLALAQQNAANNTAQAQGAISGQAQINAAQERLAAEQAAFGARASLQQQAAGQAQFQAGMQQTNRDANDRRALAHQQLAAQATQAEMNARTQEQGILAQSYNQAEGANQATAQKNAESKGVFERIGDFLSDIRAKDDVGTNLLGRLPEMGAAAQTSALTLQKLGFPSDEDTKVVPLYEPPGKQLHQSLDGHAFYASESSDDYGGRASLSGPEPSFGRSRGAKSAPPMLNKGGKRKAAPRDLEREADALMSSMREKHDARMALGPAVNPIAEANRSMAGQPYAYKPGFAPPSQSPGEVNVGPMAQNLERSPVAATAVKTDPATGMKMVDRDKALKVTMSGIADLQRQQDELRMMLAKGGRR